MTTNTNRPETQNGLNQRTFKVENNERSFKAKILTAETMQISNETTFKSTAWLNDLFYLTPIKRNI